MNYLAIESRKNSHGKKVKRLLVDWAVRCFPEDGLYGGRAPESEKESSVG